MNADVQLLDKVLFQVDDVLSKQYLEKLTSLPVVSPNYHEQSFTPLKKIDSISYNLHEMHVDKLTNIYNVLMTSTSSIVYVIVSDGNKCDFYLGVRDEDSIQATTNSDALIDSFVGNFPGSSFSKVKPKEITGVIDEIFKNQFGTKNCIASVSSVPSLKTERGEFFIQGMENFIDSMRGKKFSAIIIADPLSREQLAVCRKGYEDLYTQLSPFATSDINIGTNESNSVTVGSSKSITEGILESISSSLGTTKTHSTNQSKGENHGRNIIMDTIVSFFGGKRGTNTQEGSSEATSEASQKANTQGTQHAEMHQESRNDTKSIGSSKSLQTHVQNKSILSLLERIDDILERLRICDEMGAWKCAAYFVAQDQKVAKVAAHSYKSLMCGKELSGEPTNINVWDENDCSLTNLENMTYYLSHFQHPQFEMMVNSSEVRNSIIDPTSIVSGNELAQLMGMPIRSLPGLPVMSFAPFGREVVQHSSHAANKETLHLGNIFHMGYKTETDVNINMQSLTMHTLVTGTTGSGKSNTVYHILNELLKQNIKILVVEPAKGEYKDIFGGRDGFKVYGTNNSISELIRINPFAFPSNIHVLEHIDKLLEIFNACWSMYAAMPSKLKQAILRCYSDKGWDLEQSINYDGEIFPDFSDLLRCLPEVINESDFSAEVKGNYIGALVERTRNMTEGLEKQIFLNTPLRDEDIFNSNCIIDISRGLSVETKSLLMGIIVMRMYEFYTSQSGKSGMNLPLRHVTVMEEAHNLLRRTSLSQSQDNANVQGKAVEMITNAMAEMRTYGEGFLIVDQSPAVLDESAIRNSNTKIIHRLTTANDYTLVAAGCSEEQLPEIPKLKDGVAVIYQNNWIHPVLCQMPKFSEAKSFSYNKPDDKNLMRRNALGVLFCIILAKRCRIPQLELKQISSSNLVSAKNYFKKQNGKTSNIAIALLDEFSNKRSLTIWDQDSVEFIKDILLEHLSTEELIMSQYSLSISDITLERIQTAIRRLVELKGYRLLEVTLTQFVLLALATKDGRYKPLYNFFMSKHS